MTSVQHWYLHVDLDAFFASVEQLDFPQYRGKPLIVGGLPEDKRSVVSTASYEARKYGVHSAMPVYQAVRLCPEGIFVRGRMKRYAELSYHIMNILKEYSPDVLQMSIDEAFVDLTGTEKLFGAPEETAMKIKQRIKAETGLTVSVGMAQTKYIAKIASDINKPDGFYKVEPGKETEFMLSLPIKDIFGVGKKSVERIKAKGIETTRQLYELSLPVIKFMFGDNQGQFLYDALRGNVEDSFSGKAKSHSISAETTFGDDITDIYTAETALLELAQGIMFRLLKEESFSRTIMIKIRYEDFSTVSIQHTYDKNILIVDDLYSKAKELFEEKYIKGRGIRLLGIGFENVETEEKSIQLELFDDGTEKKQAVEKAILSLEKKHPEIKIQKARLLENGRNSHKASSKKQDSFKIKGLLLLLGVLFFGSKNQLKAEDTTVNSKSAGGIYAEFNEDEKNDRNLKSIFQWDFNNATVDFQFSGYWKFLFKGAFNSTFGFGTPFVLSSSMPVIQQEIDLSAFVKISDHWYFSMDFLDGFTKNTYSFGYKNKETYLQEFLFSNRNIIFPDIYASEKTGYIIGGGSNQAPGFYFHFADYERQKWESDFIFRYDLTKQQSATWYGKNQVNDNKISPEKFLRGKTYVIPENIDSIADVYLENSKGEYTDDSGRKYKKLNFTDYGINYSQKILVLAENLSSTNKSILVTFSSNSKLEELITNLGTYTDSASFLGKIQNYLGSKSKNSPSLKAYEYKLTTTISDNSKPALVLQLPQAFSPFECMNKYDCGLLSTGEVSVISANSETLSTDYDVEFTTYAYTSSENYLFNDKRLYAEVINLEHNSPDFTEPYNRYPLGDRNPEIYLSGNNNSDLQILLRTYNAVTYFDIGKKAAGGTVRVYINGNLDSTASYDEDSGFVTLSREVSSSDKIYITWQEEASDLLSGAIVTAGGFKYNISDKWNSTVNIAARWPCSPLTKYADSLSSQNGFALIGAGTDYSAENFSISDQLALAVDSENSTGIYLANSQKAEENETYYLGINSGFETKITPVLNTVFTVPELSEENNRSVKQTSGITDKDISGYKIPLNFDFSAGENGDLLWAAKDIKLAGGVMLNQASEFEMAFKSDIDLSDIDIYLQLGIKAEKDFSGENPETIPAWKLTGNEDNKVINKIDVNNKNWQTIKIKLEDSDRSKLNMNSDARLIAVYSYDASKPVNGTIYAGPYEPLTQGCFVENNEKLHVTTYPVLDKASASAKKLFSSKAYATNINWTSSDSILPADDLNIFAVSYFDSSDFSNYETVSFDFSYTKLVSENISENNDPLLTLILDRNSPGISEDGDIALKLELTAEAISGIVSSTENWNKLSVNIKDRTVTINNSELPSSTYSLYINSLIQPVRQKLIINTKTKDELIKQGKFIAGNLYFEDIKPGFTARNIITAEYKKDGEIVKIKDYSLLKNGKISLKSEQNGYLSTGDSQNNNAFINAAVDGNIVFAGLKLSGDALLKASSKGKLSLLQNAGHSIVSEKPYFNIFGFEETYRYAPEENSIEKKDKISVSIKKVNLQFSSTGKGNYFQQTQNMGTTFSSAFNLFDTDFKFTANGILFQKLKGNNQITENYFTSWYDISKLQFSAGEASAVNRKLNFDGNFSAKIPFFNLTPAIIFDSEGQYQTTTEKLFENKNRISFTVPFTIETNTFTFSKEKTSGSNTIAVNTNNFGSDFIEYGKLENSQKWFYTSIPVYDLFSKKISEEILSAGNSENYYSTTYSFNWRRRFSNTVKDFYLPQAANLSLSRDIRTTDSISDLYQIKSTLTCMSVNIFGSNGNTPVFNFFESDEYTLSLTSAIKIPADKLQDTQLQLSAYGSMLLYISNKNVVKAGFDLTVDTNANWLLRTSASWNRNSGYSLLTFIPSFLFENFSTENLKIQRKEIMNFTAGSTDSISKITAEYSHKCDLNFQTNYWITTDLTGTFGYTEASIFRMGLEYSLGGKIAF